MILESRPTPYDECLKCGTSEFLTSDHMWPEFILGTQEIRKSPQTMRNPLYNVVDMVENQYLLCIFDHVKVDEEKHEIFLATKRYAGKFCPFSKKYLENSDEKCHLSRACRKYNGKKKLDLMDGAERICLGQTKMSDAKSRGNPVALALNLETYPVTKDPILRPIQLKRMATTHEAFELAVSKLTRQNSGYSTEIIDQYHQAADIISAFAKRLRTEIEILEQPPLHQVRKSLAGVFIPLPAYENINLSIHQYTAPELM